MATKKNQEPAETAKAKQTVITEVAYTVDEFAKAAEAVFGKGTSPDIVRAALRINGIESTTVSEAKKLVKEFAEKEVK